MSEMNRMNPRVFENSEEFGNASLITENAPQISEAFAEVKRRIYLTEEPGGKERESDTFHQHSNIEQGIGVATLNRRSFFGWHDGGRGDVPFFISKTSLSSTSS